MKVKGHEGKGKQMKRRWRETKMKGNARTWKNRRGLEGNEEKLNDVKLWETKRSSREMKESDVK